MESEDHFTFPGKGDFFAFLDNIIFQFLFFWGGGSWNGQYGFVTINDESQGFLMFWWLLTLLTVQHRTSKDAIPKGKDTVVVHPSLLRCERKSQGVSMDTKPWSCYNLSKCSCVLQMTLLLGVFGNIITAYQRFYYAPHLKTMFELLWVTLDLKLLATTWWPMVYFGLP